MSTLSDALKIYNVYKTFNETAEPDVSLKGPVQRSSHHFSVSTKANISWRLTVFYKHLHRLQKQKLRLSNCLKTPVSLHMDAGSAWNGNFRCRCWMRWSNYSSSISSRRGPYSRTYAICQSPPPDSRRIASGDTTLTLSSSNLNHSSNRRQRTEGQTSRSRPSHAFARPAGLSTVLPSFLLTQPT